MSVLINQMYHGIIPAMTSLHHDIAIPVHVIFFGLV